MSEYLQPLTAWLADHGDNMDREWAAACPDPDSGKVRDSATVEEFLDKYNRESQVVCFEENVLSWNYDTNITKYNQELLVGCRLCSG